MGNKHDVTGKIGTGLNAAAGAATKAAGAAKGIDEKYDVSGKVASGVRASVSGFSKLAAGAGAMAEKMKKGSKDPSSSPPQTGAGGYPSSTKESEVTGLS